MKTFDQKLKFLIKKYRISSYSFCRNHSFCNLEIQRSQYIRPKVTVNKGAETIQGRKVFIGGNYKYKFKTRKKNNVAPSIFMKL